ncbi:MAG: PIG-L family deacetylase [Ruminococcus sp.]|nr:PIG-L family deacetylase [Ruminococcus sp.]
MKRLYFAFAALLFALTCAVTFVLHLSYDRAHDVAPLSAESIDCPPITDKLMIVAHPDDETLWGGAHLLDGGWLVVSLTHGSDPVRSAEFSEAVTESGNTPLMLSYPDKVNLRRDGWDEVAGGIESDIATLLQYREWQTVATHNPAGEYGHVHHKRTSALVTEAFTECGTGTLYYFGDYHSARRLPEFEGSLTPVAEDRLDRKRELCGIYCSQKRTVAKLAHMLPYEEWEEAELP